MTVVYETCERAFVADIGDGEQRYRYRMQVEKDGEFSDAATPYMVWQVDLDLDGKPWNATPCIGFASLSEAVEYLDGYPEAGGRQGLVDRLKYRVGDDEYTAEELAEMDIGELENILYQLEN